MKYFLPIIIVCLMGCQQDFSTGLQIACDAADGVNPGDSLSADEQAAEAEKKRVTNPEVLELLESMRGMQSEERRSELQQAVTRAGIQKCSLLDAMRP